MKTMANWFRIHHSLDLKRMLAGKIFYEYKEVISETKAYYDGVELLYRLRTELD